MSLLHTALKKAEREGTAAGGAGGEGVGRRLMVDTESPSDGGAGLRVYLLAAVAVAALCLVVFVRLAHRFSPPRPAVAVSPVPPVGGSSPAPELLQHASQLIAAQQWAEAKTELEKAVILEPRNTEAYSNLGLALRKLGQKDEASEQYQKALAIDPHCAECRNNLGVLYLEDRRLAEAREEFQKAVADRPDYADPYFHLALVAEAEGKTAEAKENYKKFTELARGIDARFLLAIQKRVASL